MLVMVDWIGYMLQGFFVGIGAATANWLHDKQVKKLTIEVFEGCPQESFELEVERSK